MVRKKSEAELLEHLYIMAAIVTRESRYRGEQKAASKLLTWIEQRQGQMAIEQPVTD